MAVTAKVLELWFSQFFLVCLTTRSSLVKVNKETKEFIRLVIENSNRQVICFSSGPVRAIPRGTRVKNAVGDSPSAFLVPDVLLWDPLLHFPELVLLCPSCARNKESNITSCDHFKKRCKCFQSVKGCNDYCQCLECENPYGKKAKAEYNSYPSETSKRKRRAQEMTTESMSGKHFLLKRPCLESVSRWTLLEELVKYSEKDRCKNAA